MDTNQEHSAPNALTMALMHAAKNHQLETVKELIRTPGIFLNEVNQNGDTALMLAAQNNPFEWSIEDGFPCETIKALLSHPGIQVNAVNEKTGYNALIIAAYSGDANNVSALLSASNIDVNFITQKGNTALTLAAQNGHTTVVKALLSFPGILVNLKNKKGETAFMLAQKLGYPDIAALLIEAGAKLPLSIKLKHFVQKKGNSIKNLYAEFIKHPTYYLFSGATRLTLGALVGYGLSYGLTPLAAPYLASVAISKSITVISMLGGIFASTKLGNSLLVRFFGEIKLTAGIFGTPPWPDLQPTTTVGLSSLLFNQDNPYVTPLSEIVEQLEKSLKGRYKYNPDEFAKSRTYALAYARELVQAEKHAHLFDSDAKAEVNAEPYVSAATKLK